MSKTTTTTSQLKVEKGEDGRWLVTDGEGFVHSEHDTRTAARAAKAEAQLATPPAEPEPTPEPEVADEPTEDLSDFPQGELVVKAQADHKAASLAKKAGEPIPPTPYLDELNRRHAAGEKGPKTRKAAAKVEQPRPEPGRGFTVVELRNDKHGVAVTGVLGEVDESYVDGRYLVVKNTDAQAVADQLVEATTGASQFEKRLLTLAHLAIRQAFPKVTDDRTVLVARLVSALNEQERDWSVGWATDATPTFTVDGTEHATARAAAEAVGVPTKAS